MSSCREKNEGDVVSPSLWDPLVRLTHWAIAACVIVNGLISDPGKALHVWIGWAVLGILAVRLVWGLIGPSEARFVSFLPDPRAAVLHVIDLVQGSRPRDYPSHNPAGALMVYALWASLGIVIATGLIMTDAGSPMQVAAEQAAVEAGDWSLLAQNALDVDSEIYMAIKHAAGFVHEVTANLLMFLAALHVVGVFVEGRVMRRNLVKPMLLGDRK
ncbi:cytochrome B [Cohaesibacter sp. CAU 1516]|uniref:cytochrome b/b6 domain-containing protein n=1 Tax=Cohaesibacter sp. CAU 1516 TaxID=2576038 RepID=UPI0010FCFD37|nr:cytochrome b/b6 domain-containing protein [Cohaesibacter sp. CAU 1516]TLP48172.1 cytochrome B [Cohaesibacter sp. CAU 1516]